MISVMARMGRGLPGPRCCPSTVNEVTQVPGSTFFAMRRWPTAPVRSPFWWGRTRRASWTGLAGQIGLAETVMEGLGYGGGRIHILDELDPDGGRGARSMTWRPEPATARRRRPAASCPSAASAARMHAGFAPPATSQAPRARWTSCPCPPGAPFGSHHRSIRPAARSAWLASAPAPPGRCCDNPDRPWTWDFKRRGLRPVRSLPQHLSGKRDRPGRRASNFTDAAPSTETTLNEAEPFLNVSAAASPSACKQSIEKHRRKARRQALPCSPADEPRSTASCMCDDCRVIVQFDDPDAPMEGRRRGPRPRAPPTTTCASARSRRRGPRCLAERAGANGAKGDGVRAKTRGPRG